MDDMYREFILDHYKNPRFHGVLEPADISYEDDNPLCGDEITLFFHLENDQIFDVSFKGSGCAISKASASIMTTLIKGKTVPEAETLFERFHTMITTGETNGDIGKLVVLAGVHKFPSRVKCAVLSWHTMNNVLHGNSELTTTETI